MNGQAFACWQALGCLMNGISETSSSIALSQIQKERNAACLTSLSCAVCGCQVTGRYGVEVSVILFQPLTDGWKVAAIWSVLDAVNRLRPAL